ncbi:MAG: hypothetical protein RJA99_3273 [Pseudomonadota bacterium]
MKLRAKLLLLPAIGSVSLLAVCILVTMMQLRANSELETLADVRFGAYAKAYRIQGELSSMQGEAYRTILWIDTLQDSVVKGRREALSKRGAALVSEIGVLRGDAVGEVAGRLDALSAATGKYVKAVDEAIDLASANAATGGAAMQAADASHAVSSKLAAEVVEAERAAATASVVEAKSRDRRNLGILWAATVAALVAAFAFSWVFNRRLLQPLNAAREAADSIAAGNLRLNLPEPPADEIGQLISALKRMAAHLSSTIGSIKASGEQIATASTEIAVGNNDLSRRTEQQAASLQQTSSSMAQLTGTVATNADNARQANQLALGASEVARRGGDVVEQVVATMGEISESSRKIVDIISVIDGIAFQTNILALNAAVEAARAGEQGRGFAVVAGEVRSLAQRSAEAARQIKGLITDSVERVDSGSRLVKDAGETMAEIVTSVRRVTDIIGEISSATGEQSTGIGQVNTAVGHLDQMTQQNAALVEQSAAAAESLKEQARLLAQAIDAFRLDGAPTVPAPDLGPGTARADRIEPSIVDAEVRPSDAGIASPRSTASTPATSRKPAAAAPKRTLSQPASPKPAASRSASPKPAASRPMSSKPAAAPKPVAVSKPAAPQPVASKPAGPQPAASTSAAPSRPASSTARPVSPSPAAKPAAAEVRPSGAPSSPTPPAAARPAAPKPPAPAAKVPDDDWEEF